MTRWSKQRELSSTPMACRGGVWSVTWSLHPASTMCMVLPAFLAWATSCSSWMKLETKTKWIVKYPSLGSAFWRQLIFLLLMNNLLVFPSFPPLYEIFVHQGGNGELGIRLSVFYQEKIKVRECTHSNPSWVVFRHGTQFFWKIYSRDAWSAQQSNNNKDPLFTHDLV